MSVKCIIISILWLKFDKLMLLLKFPALKSDFDIFNDFFHKKPKTDI